MDGMSTVVPPPASPIAVVEGIDPQTRQPISWVDPGNRRGRVVLELKTGNVHKAMEMFGRSSVYGPVALKWAAERGLHGANIDPRQTAPYGINSRGENVFLLNLPAAETPQQKQANAERSRPVAYRFDVEIVAQ